MRARLVAAVAVSLVVAVGCGAGSKPLEPPSGLQITQGALFDSYDVSWVEPAEQVDGYEIDWRLGAGAWELLTTELIEWGVTGGWVTVTSSVPELTLIGLRIRSARGSARSAWSAEATVLRGVRPPTTLTSSVAQAMNNLRIPPVHLEWLNESQVATGLELERAPVDGPGAGIFGPIASFAVSVTAHDDLAVWEGAWDYRLRAGDGTTWSTWTGTRTVPVDIVPPAGLVATATGNGVQLAWINPSHLAQQVVTRIEPSGGGTWLATLGVGSNQYLDAPHTPWPATRYEVTAWIPYMGSVAGPIAAIGNLLVTAPIALGGSAKLAPGAVFMDLTGSGLLHVARSWFPLTVDRDTGAGWSRHDLTGAQGFAQPAVLADENGRPHTVVYRGYPEQPTTALVHEWWDGAAWQEETVTMAPTDGASFGVGPGGVLHVLVGRRETSGSITEVHHAVAGGNVVSTELVATVLPPPPDIYPYEPRGASLAVARDGTAWLAVSYSAAPLADTVYVLLRRTAAGSWNQELTPAPQNMSVATVIAGSSEDAALLYDRMDPLGDVWLRVLPRGAGGWGAEEIVTTPLAGMNMLGAALSPDGARVAVLLRAYPNGVWLSERGPGGWSTGLLGSPPPYVAWLRTSWDGRFTVLVPHGDDVAAEAWVSLFVEPP